MTTYEHTTPSDTMVPQGILIDKNDVELVSITRRNNVLVWLHGDPEKQRVISKRNFNKLLHGETLAVFEIELDSLIMLGTVQF